MRPHQVISSLQPSLLLKNLFSVCFPPASISFAIPRVGIVRYIYIFLLRKKINFDVKKMLFFCISAVDVAYILVAVVCNPSSFYRATSTPMGELRRG